MRCVVVVQHQLAAVAVLAFVFVGVDQVRPAHWRLGAIEGFRSHGFSSEEEGDPFNGVKFSVKDKIGLGIRTDDVPADALFFQQAELRYKNQPYFHDLQLAPVLRALVGVKRAFV